MTIERFYVRPSKPIQSAFVGSFSVGLRDEDPNEHAFCLYRSVAISVLEAPRSKWWRIFGAELLPHYGATNG